MAMSSYYYTLSARISCIILHHQRTRRAAGVVGPRSSAPEVQQGEGASAKEPRGAQAPRGRGQPTAPYTRPGHDYTGHDPISHNYIGKRLEGEVSSPAHTPALTAFIALSLTPTAARPIPPARRPPAPHLTPGRRHYRQVRLK